MPGPLLDVDMWKMFTPLWREAHFQVNMYKHLSFGILLEVDMSKKCTPLQKVPKTEGYGALLNIQMSFCLAGAGDCVPCEKWAKREGFVAVQHDGRRGTFEDDLERCISRGRRSTSDTWVRCVRRSGRRFPERSCILEHEIFRFAKMILRDRRSTSYDLASLFRGRPSTLDRWSGKIAKHIGTRPSALHSTFHFWRKSCRIASFLMLPTWKLRKSRWIASFLTLSSSKIEEASQNSFAFKLADR